MKWTPENVTAKRRPEAMARSYLEFRQLHQVLDLVPVKESAAELGAGFGRLCLVLQDRFDAVTAFERDGDLVKGGRRILPGVRWTKVDALDALPAAAHEFDFAMTFTVLQHIEEREVRRIVGELKRVVRPGGYALIVEETDPTYERHGRVSTHYTFGRSVRWYRGLMQPFRLIHVSRRPNEAGHMYLGKPKPVAGHYMLFAGPEASQ